MRVAVTGAGGFVGGAAAARFSRAGHEVIPIVRRSGSQDAVVWDITHPFEGAPPAVDCVIHAAALVNDGAGEKDARRANVAGTKYVLEAFPNARFIYISSASVYDPKNPEFAITEASPAGTHLLNAYSRTKYEAEQLVLADRREAGVVVIRPHVIYGAGDQKIVPRLLRAHRFGRFLVLGNGKNRISVTHIDNLSDALLRAATVDLPSTPQVVNITDAEPVQVEQLIAKVKSAHGITAENLYLGTAVPYLVGVALEMVHGILSSKNPPFISRYLAHQMTSDHDISSQKARTLIGYAPVKSFADYHS